MTPQNFATFSRSPRIVARHAVQVRELYDRWSTTEPVPTSGSDRAGIGRVRAAARAAGWVGPLAWDDDTIDDPATRPDLGSARDARSRGEVDEIAVHRAMHGDRTVRLRISDRAEVIRRLAAQGANDAEIERRTGIASRTALRVRQAGDVDACSHGA